MSFLTPKVDGKDRLTWELIGTSYSENLSPRSGHSSASLQDKVYSFGGCSNVDGGQIDAMLNDVAEFDSKNHKWYPVRTFGARPQARASHCLCSDGQDTLFLVGGRGENGFAGGMFCLNVRSRRWYSFHFSDEVSQKALLLYGQTLAYYQDSLISFGGRNDCMYTSETFQFDLKTEKWKILDTLGEMPSGRYKHESFIANEFDAHRLFVLGGGDHCPKGHYLDGYTLNLESLKWEKLHFYGIVPVARVAFGSCYDSFQQACFIYGGFGPQNERLNDLFCLEFRSMSWKRIQLEEGPQKRAFHSMFFMNGTIFVYGGSGKEKRFSDTWKLCIRRPVPSLKSLATKKVQENNITFLKLSSNLSAAEGSVFSRF